ncbi:hypothetical protein CRG98_000919 [Punica granatum]|uniref:Uncharacterized protein n=1 Tax=Punica granatum TaxID=22663 RepID=A0A2I0LDE4_PUNGR|nr:hypothetical protein CRG98_000919 [Punica granatum]
MLSTFPSETPATLVFLHYDHVQPHGTEERARETGRESDMPQSNVVWCRRATTAPTRRDSTRLVDQDFTKENASSEPALISLTKGGYKIAVFLTLGEETRWMLEKNDGYDVSLEEFDWHARILCCFLVKPMPNGQDLVMVDEVDVANMLEDLWESYFLVLAPDIESYRGNFANLIVGGAA